MTRVAREVRRFATTRPGVGVMAVSGGADSVALFRALHAAGAPVVVAHVNHQLRGQESDADEAFVRDLCAGLGVEFCLRSVDVAALAAGANLESTARLVRYEFFAAVANEVGAAWIATAHTADDQAETVLHRLIRGAGLQGLRGIAAARPTTPAPLPSGRGEKGNPPPSPLPEGRGSSGPSASIRKSSALGEAAELPLPASARSLARSGRAEPIERASEERGLGGGSPPGLLVRPLLAVTRADVVAYLAEIGQPYRTDSSNADTKFTRNRIRHELLPLLKTFNPDIVNALMHVAEHATEAHEVVTGVATDILARAERPRAASAVILDRAVLLTGARGLTRAALRLVWEREGWPVSDMTFDAWERAVEVACGEASACDFPGGVTVRRSGKVVQLTRRV